MAEINTDNLQNLRGFILVDFEDFLYLKKIKYKFNIINRLAFHMISKMKYLTFKDIKLGI